MAFIDSLLIALKSPSGFWAIIINSFEKFAGVYFLAIILLTICIRLILSPLDFFNRKKQRYTSEMMKKMNPELKKIQQKYGNDITVFNQKRAELYKRYGFNQTGNCVFQFIYIIASSAIFLTLCSSMSTFANYKIAVQYQDLKTTYANVLVLNENENFVRYIEDEDYEVSLSIVETVDGKKALVMDATTENPDKLSIQNSIMGYYQDDISNEDIARYVYNYSTQKYTIEVEEENEAGETVKVSQEVDNPNYNEKINNIALSITYERYKDTKVSFLWVRNIWKADSPFVKPVFSESSVKNYISKYYSEEEKAEEKENDYEGQIYNAFMNYIDEKEPNVNGYLILAILTVAIAVASIKLTQMTSFKKKKDETTIAKPQDKEDRTMQITQNVMMFILPVIMGIFAMTSTCIFGIYLLTGQIFAVATTPLTNYIIDKVKDKEDKKKQQETYVDYRRK